MNGSFHSLLGPGGRIYKWEVLGCWGVLFRQVSFLIAPRFFYRRAWERSRKESFYDEDRGRPHGGRVERAKKIVKLRRLGLSLTFPNPSPTTSCDMSAKKEFSCHYRF